MMPRNNQTAGSTLTRQQLAPMHPLVFYVSLTLQNFTPMS